MSLARGGRGHALGVEQRFNVAAYLPLDEQQGQEFPQVLTTEPHREVKTMQLTTYDRASIRVAMPPCGTHKP